MELWVHGTGELAECAIEIVSVIGEDSPVLYWLHTVG